jgi:hypothetical protein
MLCAFKELLLLHGTELFLCSYYFENHEVVDKTLLKIELPDVKEVSA